MLRGTAAGFLAGAMSLPRAAGSERDPPPFGTVRAQFITVVPARDVGHVVVRDLGGGGRPLASFRGKAILLAFWASWCPPCRRELPILHRLQTRSRGADFVVVPVSLDSAAGVAAAYIDRLGLDGFESFIDPDGQVASGPRSGVATPFALYGMPMSYVIDAGGRSVGYLTGEADWSTPAALALLRHFAAP